MRLPQLARTTHKWLGLLLGLQVVIWTLSGAYMVAVHIDIIHGDHLIRKPPEPPIALAGLIEPAAVQQRFEDVHSIKLQTWMDRPVYIVHAATGPELLDARTGELLSPIDEATVRTLAQRWMKRDARIVKAELLESLPIEVQSRKPPLWRVEFEGWDKPTFYFSPFTGEFVSRRHELWRFFDFVWSLHIMDYVKRTDVNNPLLRVATVSSVVMTVSGAWLLLYSFPRRRRKKAAAAAGAGAPVKARA